MKHCSILILAVLLCAAGLQAADPEQHPAAPSDPRFEFLKSLEGSWSGAPMEEGRPPNVFEFRVTAGGHAIEEREFVGTPMEMLTLYHMQGEDLVATHYCMLGNRPRLKAEPRVVDSALSFDCDGTPGNAASHDEEHVHGWAIKLADDGRLHYSAELVKEGEVTEAPNLVLTRTRDTASR